MKTIIITGMHRTGSSLVARMFYEFGVNLGTDLMQGDETNPEGYFENWDFVNMNNVLLNEAGGSWNEPRLITQKDERCKELVEKNKGNLWGWKDNRTAFTFKAYEPFLDNVLFVITHRNKQSVINSIMETHIEQFPDEKRNKDYVGWLYDEHYRAIDEITKGYNRMDIHYEDLINNKYYNNNLKHF